MLLDKEVKVSKKYNYDLDYYYKLGYDINSDYFIVKIEHLPKKSFTKVNVKCEYCDVNEIIPYYKWNRSMQSDIKKYCCKSCKGCKIKESNLLKYGVTSVGKLESSKQKSRITNKEKYGVEFQTQSKQVKDKIKRSNLNKWNVENPMQSDIIKEKQRNTILETYGVDNVSKLEEIKNKKRETTYSNYGVDHHNKCDIYRNKFQISKNENYLNYLNNGKSLFKCNKGHEFIISYNNFSDRIRNKTPLCTICSPIGDQKSIKEYEFFEFIKSIYRGEIVQSYRENIEIDVYLPDLKLGFEFNGLYWHSDIYKEKDFHLKKTEFFNKSGIRIIHIWEDDWDNKRDIIKSQISNLLNINNNRIFARNCHVELISSVICKEFLNKNHIQGSVTSVVKLGLYLENDLVSVMTFDHFEGRKKMKDDEWNLSRFCNKLDASVVGGASKLLKYFINNYSVKRVISYADRDWSRGNLYDKLGFNLISQGKPDYKYLVGGKRVHKSGFRKSKTNISESNLLIPRIWDCGKIKFEKIFY